jgi:hypothetical protein
MDAFGKKQLEKEATSQEKWSLRRFDSEKREPDQIKTNKNITTK